MKQQTIEYQKTINVTTTNVETARAHALLKYKN